MKDEIIKKLEEFKAWCEQEIAKLKGDHPHTQDAPNTTPEDPGPQHPH